ncbi:hypothetical protein D1BOALGB6SA_10021 [Olavius sp. associated proteobacterium Delta 1]|nr:hypothetical protein D1BOALGB6SA_10021 [Olavius sp. associated proteobacterium Delta 1]
MATLHQEIEYPAGRYQIAGGMRVIQGFEWGIKSNSQWAPS